MFRVCECGIDHLEYTSTSSSWSGTRLHRHADSLLVVSQGEVHIPKDTTCLDQRWKNERSLHRLKRHIGPFRPRSVQAFHNELKNQRIVRVWEGLASPRAHLTNKSVPQVSREIAS